MAEKGELARSERLNAGCFCISLNNDLLQQALSSALGSEEIVTLVEERCPFLFSARPVFISEAQATRMANVITAIEAVVRLPAYQIHVLATAPDIAQHDPGGAQGVFFGYDFHLSEDAIGLIEINTNAGGAMLNAVMARAHHACCLDQEELAAAAVSVDEFETRIVDMFRQEWQSSAHRTPLRSIAIVDADPSNQYLYAEFLLFQRRFERAGFLAIIADPADLMFKDGVLWHHETPIDLAYNRLTDFMLVSSACAQLRAAYLAGAVVLTPNSRAHALYADKRNLTLLSDAKQLEAFDVPENLRETLVSNTPRIEFVQIEDADRLWENRRRLFFKPTAGYGGRVAYRGDKVTKRVVAGHFGR